jgi:hypothetical protein
MIDNAKDTISKWIEKEHRIIANVQKTMVALLKTKIPTEKTEAIIELEKIVKEFPTNLNALADLETIYRNLADRITDADDCRCTIDNILKSTSHADVEIKTTCLLEQGYAMLIEPTLIKENTLEYLGRGLHYQKQVLVSIHSANKDNTTDDHLIRKGLQKFEMAEIVCSAPLPDPLWEHYYAKALNHYYDSLERLSTYKDGGFEDEMREVTIKALDKFWFITQMPMDEDNKTIVARSFAYIGHILTKRESLVQSGEQTFELGENPEFKLYLHKQIRQRSRTNDFSHFKFLETFSYQMTISCVIFICTMNAH